MIEDPENKLYTLKEVAAYLKVSRQTIYNYVTAKRLKASKLAGQREYRVSEKDLQEFIKNGKN